MSSISGGQVDDDGDDDVGGGGNDDDGGGNEDDGGGNEDGEDMKQSSVRVQKITRSQLTKRKPLPNENDANFCHIGLQHSAVSKADYFESFKSIIESLSRNHMYDYRSECVK